MSALAQTAEPAAPETKPGEHPRFVPVALLDDLVRAGDVAALRLPLQGCRVRAGFPSPADDYVEDELDLHELTGARAAHAYYVRVEGESMVGAGIHDGDVLVVDRAREPASGAVVVAAVEGGLTVKRLVRRAGRAVLLAEPDGPGPVELGAGEDAVVWGVVTFVIRDVRSRWRPRR